MNLPLFAPWALEDGALPERLLESACAAPAFSLPGAQALSAFSELLGLPDEPEPEPQEEPLRVPFPLPALLPGDVTGPVTLGCEIDFGALCGDRAALCLDMVCGRGEAYLTECARPGDVHQPAPERLAAFDSAPLTLDLTGALARRRRCRVELRFDDTRPAGVCGAVTLRIASRAALGEVQLRPQRALHALTITAQITAMRAGDYLLRAQLCPPLAPQEPESAPPAREMTLQLKEGETKPVVLAMEADMPAFIPGRPYEAHAMKLQLFEKRPDGRPGPPCDERVLLCGFPGETPDSFLPLTAKACAQPPHALLERLQALHIPAVSLPAAATDLFYRELTRAGVAVRQTMETGPDPRERLARYPCVTFEEEFTHRAVENDDPILSAWRLGSLVTHPRAVDADMTPAELLRDAAGRAISPEDAADTLAWLRAVSVRLRAEAIRQGRLVGAYCAPDEWNQPDVAQALQTALAPIHLSALPLCGAWWTCTRFNASLRAFIPEGAFPEGTALRAQAALEDAEGCVLAQVDLPCPAKGGELGLLETPLPENACVLELTTTLFAGETVVEETALPVYVGERGVLEAAF